MKEKTFIDDVMDIPNSKIDYIYLQPKFEGIAASYEIKPHENLEDNVVQLADKEKTDVELFQSIYSFYLVPSDSKSTKDYVELSKIDGSIITSKENIDEIIVKPLEMKLSDEKFISSILDIYVENNLFLDDVRKSIGKMFYKSERGPDNQAPY